jgi:hypothetical protein
MLPKVKKKHSCTHQLREINFQNVFTIKNMECPDTKMNTVTGAETLKMGLLTLMHNMFGWLPQ